MNKKIVAIFAICMLLVSALSVFATLAFLTDTTGPVTNTFTSGNVDIDLYETKLGSTTGETVTENSYTIVPNTPYDKDPTIELKTGSERSYIGATIVLNKGNSIMNAFGITNAAEVLTSQNGFKITLNTGWSIEKAIVDVANDTITYYLVQANALEATDTSTIFSKITCPDTKTVSGGSITTEAYVALFKDSSMVVNAYAVQAANAGDTAVEALKAGFPEFKTALEAQA